jgi:hypothetical protein
MNSGLQDAYNLAWKLALVIKGDADASLLDSYQAERLPVAQRLLQTTDRAFMLVVKETWLAALIRTQLLARTAAFAMRIERVRKFAFRTISQIGIRYRGSALSRTLPGVPDAAPRAGDRFPWLRLQLRDDGPSEDLFETLDDTRFNLLVFGQPAASAGTELPSALRAYAIPSNAVNETALAGVHISGPAFYLLRPDGHVALAGTRLDITALRAYLSDCGLYVDRTSSGAPSTNAGAMALRI